MEMLKRCWIKPAQRIAATLLKAMDRKPQENVQVILIYMTLLYTISIFGHFGFFYLTFTLHKNVMIKETVGKIFVCCKL